MSVPAVVVAVPATPEILDARLRGVAYLDGGVCNVTKPDVTSFNITVAETLKLSPSPITAGGPTYVNVKALPSALSAVKKFEACSPGDVTATAPVERIAPPLILRLNVKASPV